MTIALTLVLRASSSNVHILRADDVAEKIGGVAFSAQPFEVVASERFILEGMGDHELECQEDANGTCTRSPNFQRLSAGRLHAELPPALIDLLQFYSFQGHWFLHSPPLPQCLACDFENLSRGLSEGPPILLEFARQARERQNSWGNQELDKSADLAQSAWRALNLEGADELREEPCYPYIVASASYFHTIAWALQNLPPEGGARNCSQSFNQELHNALSVLSMAWNLLNQAELPNPLGVHVSHIVKCHERLINIYVSCVSEERTRELNSLIPIHYHLRAPLPVGTYAAEAAMLEHLEPDGNTILAPQLGRHNPLAFRILPFLASVRGELATEVACNTRITAITITVANTITITITITIIRSLIKRSPPPPPFRLRLSFRLRLRVLSLSRCVICLC